MTGSQYVKLPPMTDATVIWLHGLGADHSDFEPIVPELDLPRSVRFVFPDAPVRAVTINQGMRMRAWYDILQLGGGAEDEKGIREARQLIAPIFRAMAKREDRDGGDDHNDRDDVEQDPGSRHLPHGHLPRAEDDRVRWRRDGEREPGRGRECPDEHQGERGLSRGTDVVIGDVEVFARRRAHVYQRACSHVGISMIRASSEPS